MSFVQRKIDVTIALGPKSNPNGTDNFGPGTGNTKTMSGLRVSAAIAMTGGPGAATADIRVYGMLRDDMNKLTVLGKPLEYYRDNSIAISAGDDLSGMALVFQGGFYAAYQDFNSAPDGSFFIHAQVAAGATMKPVPPSTFQGSADVATIMSGLALQMGLKFENSGVSVKLANPYFPGALADQVKACAKAANINYFIDKDAPIGALAIWPRTGTRGGEVPSIGPTSGLVGYPQYTDGGCIVRSLFNPSLVMGGKFHLDTSIVPAAGEWAIRGLDHDLESQTPGGHWFTNISAYRQTDQNQ